ncbi:MAG: hypothetical protein ABSH22_10900 [Tepidisphaeraceae bacterium]|jgi:hypothetical protein
MNQTPRIDVDAEFPAAVRRAGGEVVERLLPTKSPAFDNADYIFRRDNVVAELKRLDKNVIGDPEFRAKLEKLYAKLMSEGRAPQVFGTVRVSVRQIADLDPRAAKEFLEPYKKRLARILEKANSQIKDTACYFGIEKPMGLLIVANDGDVGFELDLMLFLLHHLLRTFYSSINGIIYFTANLTVDVPNFRASRIWVPLNIHDRPAVPEQLLRRLQRAWMNRVAALTGEPVLVKKIDSGSPADVASICFTDRAEPRLII